MNVLNETDPDGPDDAAHRVADISRLFGNTRTVLEGMIRDVGIAHATDPDAMVAKLYDLQAVHLRMLAAEEAFDAQHGHPAQTNAIDLDEIRADIGRQLDRLRQSIGAK